MADVLLLTESKIASDFNKYDKIVQVSGSVDREDMLPHDIHLNTVLLGTILSQHGFDVDLIDNFLHLDSQRQRLEQELDRQPLAVGLSTTFLYDNGSVREVVDLVRSRSPTSYVILGGPSLLQFPQLMELADISVLYDGEDVLLKIIHALRDSPAQLRQIPGLYVRDGQRLVFTGERDPAPLDQSPIPNWALVPRHRDLVYPIETQRGCPYSCKYCTYPTYNLKGGRVALKSVERVLEELRNNYDTYGIHRYRLCDSNFTAPPRRALRLCKLIAQANLPIEWSCYGRVDNVNDDLVHAMREAGCKVIFVGLESGSDVILHNMNKRFHQQDIYSGIATIRRAGIATAGSFIIGFPGETEQTVAETRRVIEESGLDTYIASLFWLDHNAKIWQERETYGLDGAGGMSWCHRTMTCEEGKKLLTELLNDVFEAGGPPLGSDFDVVTLVNLGLSYEQALRFIASRQLVNLAKAAESDGRGTSRISAEALDLARRICLQSVLMVSRGYARMKKEYGSKTVV